MGFAKSRYNPDYRIPPGWLLEERLEVSGISPQEFARQCGRSPEYILELIAGETSLDEELAQRFEELLGLSAHIWLGIEEKYQNHRAQLPADAKITNPAH